MSVSKLTLFDDFNAWPQNTVGSSNSVLSGSPAVTIKYRLGNSTSGLRRHGTAFSGSERRAQYDSRVFNAWPQNTVGSSNSVLSGSPAVTIKYRLGNSTSGLYRQFRLMFDEVPINPPIQPGGIASAEAVGTPVFAGPIILPAIASAGAVGAPAFLPGAAGIQFGGVASAEAVGTPTFTPGPVTFTLPSIASAFAAGALSLIEQLIFTPTGIASGFAAGAFVLAGPIKLTGIASGFAAGTFVLAGPLILPGIATGTAIGVPIFAGPINPAGIASAEAVGVPTFGVTQIIAPGGIASAFAAGTLSLRHVTLISPTGIASAEAVGNPTFAGSAQFINLIGGIAPGQVGIPSFAGGARSLQLFIGGVERTKFLRWQTLKVESQTIGRWSLTADLFDNKQAYAPALGQTVQVLDFIYRLFAGCIIERKVSRQMGTQQALTMSIQASDKSSLCDRRRVFTSYTADQDGTFVVLDAVANFLNGEGITTQGVPASLGALGVDIPANYQTVTQLFDAVADLTVTVWWIDVFGVLHFSAIDALPFAPISITETSKNYRLHSVTTSLRDVRTTQYVRSNLNLVPADSIDGGAGNTSADETYTLPIAELQAAGFLFGAIRTALPVLSITRLRVNGVDKPFFTSSGSTYGQAPTDLSLLWWVTSGAPYVTPPTQGADSVLIAGDVVEIEYVPYIASAQVQVGEPFVAEAVPGLTLGGSFGTCGSGIIEAVEQVNDVATIEGARAIAASLLSKLSTPPSSIMIETDEPGLAVGQRIPVDLPKLFLPNATLYITSLSGQTLGKDLGKGATFRWTLEATNIPDPGNTVKYFERDFRRSTHPLPIDRFEFSVFALFPGGSVTSGLVETNKHIVAHTGKLFEATAIATIAAVDQDTLLDCLLDGQSIFGNAPLVIPAGSTSLVRTVKFREPVTFVARNQTMLPSVSTRDKSAAPSPAGSITFVVSWTY